ncbi:MAG TPA: molecular chaperone HtpG [Casimicrobiaceae bacterium]|nr:molecular chaperone HtpG [Casimicrobiaceae bacterium]
MTETTTDASRQTLGFQTEVRQLLHLMIHSLYSHREIFLRELISNASDACDRLRFVALDAPELYGDDSELAIRVDWDAGARTISVTDNGIGMSRDEVVANIGTIAKSGTREFVASMSGDVAKDASLIGQFGVGFYSAFLVADRVTLTTRKAGAPVSEGVRWESVGEGEYTIEPADVSSRGTTVTLHLREGMDEFASRHRLASIVRKYSDHIAIPVRMRKERWDEEAKAMAATDEWETVNAASALWTRPKADLSQEQYDEFYKHIAHDFEAPLAHVHAKVEGRTEYTQLLFIPARAPFDLWDRDRRHGLKLYVRRVFIMDDAQELLHAYLRFVRGVVDANDLPLNVSREILQQSRDVDTIRAGCAKRVLTLLEELAKDAPDKYATFWSAFGKVLKEGVVEDSANRDRIAKLLRFSTTRSGASQQDVSLDDYIGRVKEDQDAIWYVTADSHTAAAGSPHLEIFKRKGIEVLLLSDRVDEWMIASLDKFADKPLKSVARGSLDLAEGEDDKATKEEAATRLKPVIERIKTALGDKVADVRTSARLTDSPACLVVGEGDASAHLERILRAAGHDAPTVKPVLELNADHPLVARLAPDDPRIAEWARVLHDQALLAEGAALADPSAFVRSMNALMVEMAAPRDKSDPASSSG